MPYNYPIMVYHIQMRVPTNVCLGIMNMTFCDTTLYISLAVDPLRVCGTKISICLLNIGLAVDLLRVCETNNIESQHLPS